MQARQPMRDHQRACERGDHWAADVVRDLAGTTVTKRDEGPAFELYSVWSWYLHLRLMAR